MTLRRLSRHDLGISNLLECVGHVVKLILHYPKLLHQRLMVPLHLIVSLLQAGLLRDQELRSSRDVILMLHKSLLLLAENILLLSDLTLE